MSVEDQARMSIIEMKTPLVTLHSHILIALTSTASLATRRVIMRKLRMDTRLRFQTS